MKRGFKVTNNLQEFNFKGNNVRTIEIDGNPYFVGNDVTQILGYSNYRKATSEHVDDEDKLRTQIGDGGQSRTVTIINESGLYSLILSSKLPTAKEFKRWVTSEVLPSIRETGQYQQASAYDIPGSYGQALQLAADQQKQLELQKPKVIFADAVTTSSTSILVREMAKILKQNGIDMGEKRLFNWLRTQGYLISKKGNDYNTPTQKSMELRLFEIKETAIPHADGYIVINKTSKITGKGQQYFVNRFLKLKSTLVKAK